MVQFDRRLVPSLLATVLIYLSVIKYLGEGPFWTRAAKLTAQNCKTTWWATLFFVSNFVRFENQVTLQFGQILIDF
jgi:peptidoglycan/LPS O-acetylase OafA/YrhL